MKSFLLPSLCALFFISCSTAYQSGQTPDDVYYSPERPAEEYVRMEKADNRQYGYDRYEYYDERDERVARMAIRNRLFSVLDNDWYDYGYYSRYRSRNVNHLSNSGYFYYWNYYYNPYFNPCVPGNYAYNPYGPGNVFFSTRQVYNKPRTYNLMVFDREMNSVNPNLPKGYKAPNAGYRDNTDNYRGSGSNAGDYMRNIFGSGNSSGNGIKTSSPSGNTSSQGSSSNSSGSSSDNGSRGRASRGGN